MIKMLSAVAATILLSGCYYDVESELYGVNNCDIPADISYVQHIEPIISGKCAIAGCHVDGGTGVGVMTTYEGVMAKVNDGTFENEVLAAQTMPPFRSMISSKGRFAPH